ncbi:MAG: hypothetical protein GY898_27835 [Proteobacteria bacterium]|nr:hypothetical protein [Pseudomonadota bacterium]
MLGPIRHRIGAERINARDHQVGAAVGRELASEREDAGRAEPRDPQLRIVQGAAPAGDPLARERWL